MKRGETKRTIKVTLMKELSNKNLHFKMILTLAMQQAEIERDKQIQKRQRNKRFNSQEGYRFKTQNKF